jgi:hypothetical protein
MIFINFLFHLWYLFYFISSNTLACTREEKQFFIVLLNLPMSTLYTALMKHNNTTLQFWICIQKHFIRKKNERKKYNEETILTLCLPTGVCKSSKKEGTYILSEKNIKCFQKKSHDCRIYFSERKKIVYCVWTSVSVVDIVWRLMKTLAVDHSIELYTDSEHCYKYIDSL